MLSVMMLHFISVYRPTLIHFLCGFLRRETHKSMQDDHIITGVADISDITDYLVDRDRVVIITGGFPSNMAVGGLYRCERGYTQYSK